MHGITKREWRQTKWQLANRLWLLFLLGIVFTSSTGKPLESSLGGGGVGGWTVWLPWLEWGGAVLSVSWPWLGQQLELRGVRWSLKWLRMGSLWLLGGLVVWQYGAETVSRENKLGWSAMSLAVMGDVMNNEMPMQKAAQRQL